MTTRPRHAGLRHLALHARAYEDMRRFYVDRLGFQVEWEPDSDNVYLSSGIDNLALHRSASAETSSPSASARDTALDHLGLIVRSPDDVDAWAVYLDAEGVKIDTRPRTHRDGARSFYFRDPDGNRVQIMHHPPISDK